MTSVSYPYRIASLSRLCTRITPPCLHSSTVTRGLDGLWCGPVPWGNWPAREWPTVEDLEEARRRYPEAMFPDDDAYAAAAPDLDAEQVVLQSSFIWSMEREARG